MSVIVRVKPRSSFKTRVQDNVKVVTELAVGPKGDEGADGKTLRNGSGIPSNGLGADGDFYIDTTNWVAYGPKASGAWPTGHSMTGPQGATGNTGATGATGNAGADGKTLRNGSGIPSNGLGANGDFYIDTTSRYIYGPKASGAWPTGVSLGNIVLGQNSAPLTVGNTTALTLLASIIVPPGLLAVGDSIQVEYIWNCNNNANAKAPNLYVNGTVGPVQNDSLANNQYLQKIVIFKVVSSTLLKCIALANSSYSATGLNASTATVNISNTITIDFKGQKAVAGDTLILEHYCIRVIKS
jgi:hypothetical protein